MDTPSQLRLRDFTSAGGILSADITLHTQSVSESIDVLFTPRNSDTGMRGHSAKIVIVPA